MIAISNGCDSVAVLNLTIISQIHHLPILLTKYEWNGETYTEVVLMELI